MAAPIRDRPQRPALRSVPAEPAPALEVTEALEREVLEALLVAPESLGKVSEILAPLDFACPKLRAIYAAMQRAELVTLPMVAEELGRSGDLERAGGVAALAELADGAVSAAHVVVHARAVRRHALQRREREFHERAARGEGVKPHLAAVEEEIANLKIEGASAASRSSLAGLAFSGAGLLSLLDRPEPEPVVAGIPTPGHLTLVVAPAFSGKTSLALWTAMACAAGVAPWPGAPERPAGRVLLFSLDEAPEQVVRRMRALSVFHPAGALERYADKLEVLGPDREVDPEALDALHFDAHGLAIVSGWIEQAECQGRPFSELYVDAYGDVLPPGESENSNELGTSIGGALERLAVRHGLAVVLLHHAGKPPKGDTSDELPDLRFLSRGASSLAAKARVVTALERVPGMPNVRRVRTITNLSRTPKPQLFEVCSLEAEDEEVLRFRPHDPTAAYLPRDYLGADPISTSALAWALAGKEPESGRRPPGEFNRLASELRDQWRRAGLVEISEGPRNAKLIRLANPESGERRG